MTTTQDAKAPDTRLAYALEQLAATIEDRATTYEIRWLSIYNVDYRDYTPEFNFFPTRKGWPVTPDTFNWLLPEVGNLHQAQQFPHRAGEWAGLETV